MIDIHSHILPGIDDGPSDWAESLKLAEMYAQAGFSAVIATPHARSSDLSLRFAWRVLDLVNRLNRRLRQKGIDLCILPGMEVELDVRLTEQVERQEALTLAGRSHLLVETPFLTMPLGWRKLVFDLAARGVTVVFAHPERCAQFVQSPGMMTEMAAAGAGLQVSWDSFTGAHGREAAQLALHMTQHGLIHCLATDSHHPERRHPGMVVEATEKITRIMGTENLELISRKNPEKIVNGEVLEGMEVWRNSGKKKMFWG